MEKRNGNELIFTGERFVPGIDDFKLEMEHIQRYRCMQKLVKGKVILDAACGEGYGAAILAETAYKVVGVDISEEAIMHARLKYRDKKNLSFEQMDITDLDGICTNSIDVVISFETIEHIEEQMQMQFLNEIKRVLKTDGYLIMSTPNKQIYSDMFEYHNTWHYHEFSVQSFKLFLTNCFKNIRLLSQSFEINCMISDEYEVNAKAIELVQGNKNPLDTCKYIIAIAGNGNLPKTNISSVYVGNYGEYNERILRIIQLQEGEKERNSHIVNLNTELEEKGKYIFQLQEELKDKERIWEKRVEEARFSIEIVSKELAEQTKNLQDQLNAIEYEKKEAEEKAEYVKGTLEHTEQILKQKDEEVLRLKSMLSSVQEKTDECTQQIVALENTNAAQRQTISMLQEQNKEQLKLKSMLSSAQEKADECVQQIEALENTNAVQSQTISMLQEQNKEQIQKIEFLVQTKDRLETDIERMREIVRENEETIEEMSKVTRNHEETIKEMSKVTRSHEDTIEDKNSEILVLRDKVALLTDTYEDKQKELHQIIKNKEGHIELLLEKEREFNRIQSQRSYRVGQKLHTISSIIFPGNSTRRFVAGMILKIIRHPITMIRFFTPHRIKKFFWLYRNGGMDAVQYRFRVLEANELTAATTEDTNNFKITKCDASVKALEDYGVIEFTKFAYPEVSIVVPVYNQFAYTYECLKAIKENTEGVSYEIIIADDNSSDMTVDLEYIVKNITIIKNKSNQGFLMNCNYAAKSAKGNYILFLNNDTQVQENWLISLVRLMDADKNIGMMGSKLVYENGQLQEAGGIVWKDASAWNYGNRKSPEDPEYNYVKETDYISGACIMIRTSLWKELGGFDARFAPAYYEDTDLAFQVREHGYKVVYQPASVVVHFEGISNGTDTASGMKTYQLTNKQKFYHKWKNTLEREHFVNGEHVFLAKDRSRNKKQILVIDHYVPHFDKDAGGRCTYMWLKLFVKLGMQVTFIGDNFFKHEPYTTILNQLGIEVLYGNFYYNNYKEWLKDNLQYFDYIYLQRPHISIKYIDIIKEYGKGKVFYFAHDLHFLRLRREYELTGEKQYRIQAEDVKKTEMYLFEQADVVHVVGDYEQQLLNRELPQKIIRNIPIYIYENIPRDIPKNFAERHDLIFVGGFGHPPNVDAVLWFAREIYPKIQIELPDIKWHIVGGNVTDEIRQMDSENIIVHGFVSDDELESLYRTCRLAVVPLRVGAGVKGKVVEAAYYQIPLVTTTIGGEGISHEEHAFAIEDDPDQMAELIVELYGDCKKLEAMSNNGIKLIEKYYTLETAEKVFVQDL